MATPKRIEKGTKPYLAVNTLGELSVLVVTPASEPEFGQVENLADKVQEATGNTAKRAVVNQVYTGEEVERDAAGWGVRLDVVKFSEARIGFMRACSN